MTLKAVKNAEYYIKSYDRSVKLVNGVFESGSLGEDYLNVWIEKAILGDLNNDGKKDATVILVSSGGGTGRFYELAALINKGGSPYHVASVELGDRVIINSVIIKKREILIDIIIHGPNDAACCPTVKKLIKYRLLGNKLMEQ